MKNQSILIMMVSGSLWIAASIFSAVENRPIAAMIVFGATGLISYIVGIALWIKRRRKHYIDKKS